MDSNSITTLAGRMLALMLMPAAGFAGDGGYLGLGIGHASYADGLFRDSDTLATVYVGYRAYEHLSVEMAYLDLGEVEDRVVPDDVISLTQDTLHLDVSGITLAPVLRQRIGSALTISAMAGVAVFDVAKSWSGGTLIDPLLARDTGGVETAPFWGLRLMYQVSGRDALGITWQHHQTEDVDIDAAYAAYQARF